MFMKHLAGFNGNIAFASAQKRSSANNSARSSSLRVLAWPLLQPARGPSVAASAPEPRMRRKSRRLRL
jgi:hypothetical protein